MILRREEKSELMLPQTAGCVLRLQVDANAQRFEHVGASRLRGDGAVAVLGHGDPGGSRDDRHGRRDVERLQSVAAGPQTSRISRARVAASSGGVRERSRNSQAKAVISSVVFACGRAR